MLFEVQEHAGKAFSDITAGRKYEVVVVLTSSVQISKSSDMTLRFAVMMADIVCSLYRPQAPASVLTEDSQIPSISLGFLEAGP